MNTGPLTGVSVVMPVLNEAKYLNQAVSEILNQQVSVPIEVVLAVSPSMDETALIAAELAAADPRVVVVANPSGKTPAALNLAIAKAKFEVIVRVDGHAILTENYIQTAITVLQETNADVVGGVMAAAGVSRFEVAVAAAMRSVLGVGPASFHTGGGAGPALTVYLGVFRRAALERVGGYDESFIRAQDWELNYRIRQSGGIDLVRSKIRSYISTTINHKSLSKTVLQLWQMATRSCPNLSRYKIFTVFSSTANFVSAAWHCWIVNHQLLFRGRFLFNLFSSNSWIFKFDSCRVSADFK